MQYQVFVQSHPDNKFIASIVGIPNTTVEGSTKEKVIALVKATLETQLASGELITIEVGKERRIETSPGTLGLDSKQFVEFIS